MMLAAIAKADEPPPRDATLSEVIQFYPVAYSQLDTLRIRMALLKHDLADEQALRESQKDTFQTLLWQADFRVDMAEAVKPPWWDKFVPGYLVGIATVVLLVWGMDNF